MRAKATRLRRANNLVEMAPDGMNQRLAVEARARPARIRGEALGVLEVVVDDVEPRGRREAAVTWRSQRVRARLDISGAFIDEIVGA